MMDHDDEKEVLHFNAEKVFIALFVLTAIEVGWGYLAKDWSRLMLWGGLLFCAFWKGWLIAVYFMHLKFEGWVVKSMILPTPFLVMVIMGYVMPDVANHEAPLRYPIGAQLDPASGEVIVDLDDPRWGRRKGDVHGRAPEEH